MFDFKPGKRYRVDMNKIYGSRTEKLQRYQAAVKTMTQEQVDACAWLFGGYGSAWTPANCAARYQEILDQEISERGEDKTGN